MAEGPLGFSLHVPMWDAEAIADFALLVGVTDAETQENADMLAF
jgi:hypothetical protein